jgi:amidohydrolase
MTLPTTSLYTPRTMKSTTTLLLSLLMCSTAFAQSAASRIKLESPNSAEVNSVFPSAKEFYLDLHQHPELSSHETQTAAKMADRLRTLGYEVTEHVGGTGVVAILKNGAGPTVMLRTELDALPVEEKTGLPYASTVRTKDDKGNDVGVMQACGHDLHMSSFYGTAAIMAKTKDTWHGTLMLIGQPAEETISGARAMLEDGVFKRFPKPDMGLAMHDTNFMPVGQVSVLVGAMATNADSLKVTIYGKGGHGSAPDATIDPILIAAKTIESLQSIVSREVHPGEMAVVTVGYIRGGTKNNIIPDSVEMGLTVRSYKQDVREHVLKAINRIVAGEAAAAGVEKMPTVDRYEYTDAVVNDGKLVARLRPTLAEALGKENVTEIPPGTGSEDYSYFVNAGVPSVYFDLGVAEPKTFADAKAAGRKLPGLHSSLFAPDVDPALHTGIAAEVTALRTLLQ